MLVSGSISVLKFINSNPVQVVLRVCGFGIWGVELRSRVTGFSGLGFTFGGLGV